MIKQSILKRVIVFITRLVVLIGGIILFLLIEPQIHNQLIKCREKCKRMYEYRMMHEPKLMMDSLAMLEDKPNAWYVQNHVIAHGGGGIDGKTYTNSLEAWEYSYSRGNRVMDADLTFTTDGKLVLLHDWADNLEQSSMAMHQSYSFMDKNGHLQYKSANWKKLDFQTFMSKKIYRLYTPMSCENMLLFMHAHLDLYVATDMKDDVISSYQYLVYKAKEMKMESVLNRIIVNIYDYNMYEKIMSLYPFKNTIVRQHYVHPNNYYELVDFCVKNDIHVVNVSTCYAKDKGIQLLRSKGLRVIVAVVDYISDMQEYRRYGFSGCVSNYLYEDIYLLSEVE